MLKFKVFLLPFGLLFGKNQGRSIHFNMCMIRLAKKYCKTVQIEVKVYTEVAGPMTEQKN